MQLSEEQTRVHDQINDWLRNPNPSKPWFIVHGYAGTGKSFLLAQIARERPNAMLCAFTGKACSVLARRTGLEVSTIHRLIYQCKGRVGKELSFEKVVDDGDWHGQLALVDEVGTIGARLARDLLATGVRVVGCGDPGQLPPVKDSRFFIHCDARLEEVHRQAWDSAIIRQAHNIRANGRYMADGDDFRVVSGVSGEEILAADAILCHTNAKRHALTQITREWHGFGPEVHPQAGEPVMCLINDHQAGVLNGGIYELLEEHVPWEKCGYGRVVIRNERGERVVLGNAWFEEFSSPLSSWSAQSHPFTFGYVGTVHKWIGSEADRIILVDEYKARDGYREWAYTATTRAAKSIIVMKR